MRGEREALHGMRRRAAATHAVRTIVFHGSADNVVNPSNAERVAAAASTGVEAKTIRSDRGRSPDGRTYTRKLVAGSDGSAVVEFWLIDGGGHAWSGGDAAGSFADPAGPSASKEMVRFFLDEPQ
jgi:poly(3-hydroxybutyrate) depolymerase